MLTIGRMLIVAGCLILVVGLPVTNAANECTGTCDSDCRERNVFVVQAADNSSACFQGLYFTCQFCTDAGTKCCPKTTDNLTDKKCNTGTGVKLNGTKVKPVTQWKASIQTCDRRCTIPAN